MKLLIPDSVAETLLELAVEDEKPTEKLLEELIVSEDRRRHVDKQPFQKEARVKCYSPLCNEERGRPTAMDIIEI